MKSNEVFFEECKDILKKSNGKALLCLSEAQDGEKKSLIMQLNMCTACAISLLRAAADMLAHANPDHMQPQESSSLPEDVTSAVRAPAAMGISLESIGPKKEPQA